MSKRRRYRLIRTDTRAYIWKYLRNFNVFKNFPWCRLAKFIELTFPNVISFYVSRGLRSKLTVTKLLFEVERTTIIISRLLMDLAYQPSEKAEHHMYSMPMLLLTIASNAHHVEYLLVILSLSAYSSQLGNIWIGESPVGRLKRKLKIHLSVAYGNYYLFFRSECARNSYVTISKH